MIKKNEEMKKKVYKHMRSGNGEASVTELWQGDGLNPKIRNLRKIVFKQGSGIGYHVRENEQEFIYIISGEAQYNDDGKLGVMHAGDSSLTLSGHGHGLFNISEKDLVILEFILSD